MSGETDLIARREAVQTPFDTSTGIFDREHALHCFSCGGAIGTVTCNCTDYNLGRKALVSALEWARRDAILTTLEASDDMPTIWEDPAGKGYPCFERPMTPAEAKAANDRLSARILELEASDADTVRVAVSAETERCCTVIGSLLGCGVSMTDYLTSGVADMLKTHIRASAHPKPEPVETHPDPYDDCLGIHVEANAARMKYKTQPQASTPSEVAHTGEYLIDLLGKAVRSEPIRDMAEAIGAFRAALSNTQPQAPSEERALEVLREVSGAGPDVASKYETWSVCIRAMIRFATDTQPVAGGASDRAMVLEEAARLVLVESNILDTGDYPALDRAIEQLSTAYEAIRQLASQDEGVGS